MGFKSGEQSGHWLVSPHPIYLFLYVIAKHLGT